MYLTDYQKNPHLAIKKNDTVCCEDKWRQLEDKMLREVARSVRHRSHTSLHVEESYKDKYVQINKHDHKQSHM
jgi:hypothetical protein